MRYLSIAFLLPLFLCAESTAADPPTKIKVLILDGQNNHDWRATTPVLESILERCGRFDVSVATATKPSEFTPDFAAYDVVVSNYNGPDWPVSTQRALVDFVEGGGGLVIIHAANNSFPKWKEYNRMIGLGGWGGRTEKDGPYIRYRDGQIVRDDTPGRGGSHGAQHEFLLVTRAPDHPIMRGLPTSWLHAKDELYDRLRGPAERLTVLATAWSDPKTRGTGEHEPMLMTIDYGKGRVFHDGLGHGPLAMSSVGFQVTLQRGCEWAATGQVTLPELSAAELPADHAKRRRVEDIPPVAGSPGPDWIGLFDGKTLDGWQVRSGTAKYAAVDGTIVGSTTAGSPDTFLCTEADYADFELYFEVKVDDPLNSGVQIRSHTPDGPEGRMHGPQVEIATNGTAGFVYGEAPVNAWLSTEREDEVKKAAFRRGTWNRYRVVAKGERIKTWVNGVPVADLSDQRSGRRSGCIGLQVHAIPRGTGPYEVRWRRLDLRGLGGK